jgi:hypothetical protein
MSKYREYAMDPKDFSILTVIPAESYAIIVNECSIARIVAKNGTHHEYQDWVKTWKANYAMLSAHIRNLRDSDKYSNTHSACNALRRLVNTMLNARQYARDVRRAHENSA